MKRKIFLAFAHPDDESFITGGTIADLHHKGVEIHLYCATKGGAGKAGSPPLCSLEDLPAVRTMELQHACEILGVDHLYLRDFQDGNLMNEPDLQQDLYRAIANVEPDVVITFAPHGISGHLDHIQIQKLCYNIITQKTISTVQSLYYVTRRKEIQTNEKPFGNPTDQLHVIMDVTHTRQLVSRALQAHRTQHLSVEKVFPGIFNGNLDGIPSENVYIAAWDREDIAELRKASPRPLASLFL